ncbi:hypothetical protein SAMN04488503_0164 [Humidesulfovibrio mexicanus]|uniref:DUF2059 domain-containing protein n=1 Tax=Humidesulfovibrio mexicanus TaxID=147047 RepID=A0A239D8P4_9BACT|nr:DUF2059 domain-containing protein [Humidesulfovibrio mexicanus]SNS28700.1 hypothetical protein SAMN04488503_0164 [Humidesulfovibrio mexicanus]
MPRRQPRRIAFSLVLLVLLVSCLASLASAEELTPEKRADIRALIEATDGAGAVRQKVNALGDQAALALRRKRPDTPERALELVRREVRAVLEEKLIGPGGLYDRLTPLYAKTFTHREIRELLAFYASPTGRKAVESMPGLSAESRAAAEALAREIAPELKRRIEAALTAEGLARPRQQ